MESAPKTTPEELKRFIAARAWQLQQHVANRTVRLCFSGKIRSSLERNLPGKTQQCSHLGT
jgi:hypothetical protein